MSLTPYGKDILTRLSDPTFSEKFNIRGDKDSIGIGLRGRSFESVAVRTEGMVKAAENMAKFTSQVNFYNVGGFDLVAIRGNVVALRDRMIKNAGSFEAKASIKSNMNRTLWALRTSTLGYLYNQFANFTAAIDEAYGDVPLV